MQSTYFFLVIYISLDSQETSGDCRGKIQSWIQDSQFQDPDQDEKVQEQDFMFHDPDGDRNLPNNLHFVNGIISQVTASQICLEKVS